MTETEAIRQNYELGVLAGEAREQQRIIKLLDESYLSIEGKHHLIALIKGEK